jgi:hypothetical protein
MRECVHCECNFDPETPYKRRVGGRINECPDCVVELETEISETIRAVSSGDGKMACIQILKFESEEDADLYRKGWDQWSAGTTNVAVLSMTFPLQRSERTQATATTRGKYDKGRRPCNMQRAA